MTKIIKARLHNRCGACGKKDIYDGCCNKTNKDVDDVNKLNNDCPLDDFTGMVLTDEDIDKAIDSVGHIPFEAPDSYDLARAIEALVLSKVTEVFE